MTYTLDTIKQASWRTHPTSVDFFLFLHTPSIVFQAKANMPPATYPLYLFLYDEVTIGSYLNIREDMMLLLGTTPGGDDLGRVRIRKNLSGVTATSSIIYIQRSSQGILDGEIDMQNDAYVTVLDFFPLWSIPQLIDSNGIMYEDSEIAFSDTIHLLPVANAGVDFLEVLESVGNTVQKTFGENASYATAPGATISSRLWTFPDGQTSSSATPTITFTANTIGYYSLAITDSLGNVKTSRRYMAVVAKNHPLLIRDWEIESHVARPDGQEISIIIHDPIPYGQYIDGIECLISMRERRGTTLGGLVGSTGFENMIFAGYLGQEDMRGETGMEGYLAETTFTLLDNAGKLKTLPGFTELKERESTPTTWAHMKSANIDRYVASILDHRSNALRRMDMVWSGTGETYAFTVLGSDGGNLYDQADGRCQAISYKLTCDRYGRLQMRPDPQLQAEASKTADVIVPIRETDWSNLKRVYGRSPTTHWNWGESILVSTANASAGNDIGTLWNVSPGTAPGQGLASQTSGEQLATSQDELNIRERHRYERLNNLFKGNVEVLIANDGYFCDPALMKWAQLEITSQHAGVRGRSWISTTRFLPLEMNYQYDHENGIRTQRIVLEKEIVTTRKAVTYFPPDSSGFTDPGSPIYQPPFITTPSGLIGGNLNAGQNNILVGFANKTCRLTGTFTAASPIWSTITLSSLSGTGVKAGVQLPTEPTSFVIATTAGVRKVSNITTSPSYGTEKSFRATPLQVRLQIERANTNWVQCHATYADGVYTMYSLDGGLTWSSEVRTGAASIGSPAETFGFTNSGIWLSPFVDGHCRFSAFDGSVYNLYESFNRGVTANVWSPGLTTGNHDQTLHGMMGAPYSLQTKFYFHEPFFQSGNPALGWWGHLCYLIGGVVTEINAALNSSWVYDTGISTFNIQPGTPHVNGLAIPPHHPLKMMLVVYANAGQTALFRSLDGGATGTQITASITGFDATGRIEQVFTASDGLSVYALGNGYIGFSGDFGATALEDKTGTGYITAGANEHTVFFGGV